MFDNVLCRRRAPALAEHGRWHHVMRCKLIITYMKATIGISSDPKHRVTSYESPENVVHFKCNVCSFHKVFYFGEKTRMETIERGDSDVLHGGQWNGLERNIHPN